MNDMQNTVIPDKTTKDEPSPKYIVASLKRALELLDVFLEPPHEFGLTELSQQTGQTKNQTYRFLQTLVAHNVVVMEGNTKKYSLGHRPLEWGVVAQHHSPIAKIANTYMDELASAIGETVILTTLADDRSAICIDKRESTQTLQISAKVGRRVPLHAGAGGKCLLAHSPSDLRKSYLKASQPMARFTARTIIDPHTLEEELRHIRSVGYSISDEDLDEGACSVAAPIFTFTGQVVASMSIASPQSRFSEKELARNRTAVINAAAEISRRLGYRS